MTFYRFRTLMPSGSFATPKAYRACQGFQVPIVLPTVLVLKQLFRMIMLHLLYTLSSWRGAVSSWLKTMATHIALPVVIALGLGFGGAVNPVQAASIPVGIASRIAASGAPLATLTGMVGVDASLLAALPAGNPITDGKALLRYALPIDNPSVRELQASLEDINTQLRANRRWPAVARDVQQARRVLDRQRDDLLASVTPDHQARATEILTTLETTLDRLQADTEAKDKEAVWTDRAQALDLVGELEEYMVQAFPFQVPDPYQNLPQLKGRATIALKTERGDLTIVVDGYNAPVTAGNFVDLVQRGFYDGLEFTRAEDGYVLQAGDPPGEAAGFIDPQTNTYRAIPLEIRVQDDPLPIYGVTLETAGRYLEQPVLPFSAYGTLAMARPGDDPNGGSSQFFFLLFQPELTPAGSNLLDGRYSVFGYVTEGKEVLGKLKQGDKIISAKVISGAENLEPAQG